MGGHRRNALQPSRLLLRPIRKHTRWLRRPLRPPLMGCLGPIQGGGPQPGAGIPETLLPYQDRATAGLEQWSVIPQPAGHKGRSGGEQRSPQRLSRPRKIALRIVIAVLAVSLLHLGYAP